MIRKSLLRISKLDRISNKMDRKNGRRMSTISTEEVLQLQGEFAGLDQDGNGEIEIDELGSLLKSMRIKLQLSEADIRRALKQIDRDGDGTVDIPELNRVIEKYDANGIIYKALSQRSQIRREFERFDTDKSGFITKDELVEIVNDRTGILVSEKVLDRMIKDCDENEDGMINYEEFCTMMTKSFMQKRVLSTKPKLPVIRD